MRGIGGVEKKGGGEEDEGMRRRRKRRKRRRGRARTAWRKKIRMKNKKNHYIYTRYIYPTRKFTLPTGGFLLCHYFHAQKGGEEKFTTH